MKGTRRSLLFSIILIFMPQRVSALLVPDPNVPRLVESSDTIIVGHVISLSIDKNIHENKQTITISPRRILKGDPNASKNISVIDNGAEYFGTFHMDQYGIFFLKSNGVGSYAPADPFHPVLLASSNAPEPAGASALELVASELTNVLFASADDLLDSNHGINDLASYGPEAKIQLLYHQAASAIGTLPPEIGMQGLTGNNRCRALICRLWVQFSMTSLGFPLNLNGTKEALLDPPADLSYSVIADAQEIDRSLNSVESVAPLTILLHSKSAAVRHAAAHALSRIGTERVLEPLAQLALVDPNQSVRYFAVLGLSKETGSRSVPSMESFMSNEQAYLRQWTLWAREHGY